MVRAETLRARGGELPDWARPQIDGLAVAGRQACGELRDQAVARGITGSAGTVTSAAAVMVAVFAISSTLTTLDSKQFGVGLAAAILLDAAVIRAVVLPSATILLGQGNWWTPRVLARAEMSTARPDHEPTLVRPAPHDPRHRVASRP